MILGTVMLHLGNVPAFNLAKLHFEHPASEHLKVQSTIAGLCSFTDSDEQELSNYVPTENSARPRRDSRLEVESPCEEYAHYCYRKPGVLTLLSLEAHNESSVNRTAHLRRFIDALSCSNGVPA